MKVEKTHHMIVLLSLTIMLSIASGCSTPQKVDSPSKKAMPANTSKQIEQPSLKPAGEKVKTVEEQICELLPAVLDGKGDPSRLFALLPGLDWKALGAISQHHDYTYELHGILASIELTENETASILKASRKYDTDFWFQRSLVHRLFLRDKALFIRAASRLDSHQIEKVLELLSEIHFGFPAIIEQDTARLLEKGSLTPEEEAVARLIRETVAKHEKIKYKEAMLDPRAGKVEKQICKLLVEAPDSSETRKSILNTVQNINWRYLDEGTEPAQIGWSTVISWLGEIELPEEKYLINIMKAQKGLDAALSESYCSMIGERFMQDKARFVRCAGRLKEDELESLCCYVAYSSSYDNLNIIRSDMEKLLEKEDLSDKEKHVVESLLEAFDIYEDY